MNPRASHFDGGGRATSGVQDLAWHYHAIVATNGATDPLLFFDGQQQPIEVTWSLATINLFPSARPRHAALVRNSDVDLR